MSITAAYTRKLISDDNSRGGSLSSPHNPLSLLVVSAPVIP